MVMLALDQACEKTGYALFCDGALCKYGLICANLAHATDYRFSMMMASIFKLIDDMKPNVVILEDVQVQKNAATAILLARLQGAVIGHCHDRRMEYSLLSANVWRKRLNFAQGRNVKRPQLKAQAQIYVSDRFGVTATEDEADAICIGCAAIQNK